MNPRVFTRAAQAAGVLAALPLAAQINVARRVERPSIPMVVREPALYVYDEFAWDGHIQTFLGWRTVPTNT